MLAALYKFSSIEMGRWKIYYDDGSTFSSDQGSPEQAPSLGFICAVGYDEEGNRYIMHGYDHYSYDLESEQWFGSDIAGLLDRLLHNKVFAYKMGRTLTKSAFREIMSRAHNDKQFPQ